MRGNIALAGFFGTADEWEALDLRARALLVGAAHPPLVAWDEIDDAYEAYELVLDHRAARAA